MTADNEREPNAGTYTLPSKELRATVDYDTGRWLDEEVAHRNEIRDYRDLPPFTLGDLLEEVIYSVSRGETYEPDLP